MLLEFCFVEDGTEFFRAVEESNLVEVDSIVAPTSTIGFIIFDLCCDDAIIASVLDFFFVDDEIEIIVEDDAIVASTSFSELIVDFKFDDLFASFVKACDARATVLNMPISL